MTDALPRPHAAKSDPRDAELITGRDLVVMLGIAVLTPIAWLVPESRWHPLTETFARVVGAIGVGGGLRRRLDAYFAGRAPRPVAAMAAGTLGYYVDSTLQVLRGHRP